MTFPDERPCNCGDGTETWIMVEVQGVYDGGLFWTCARCGEVWHRWPPTDRLYGRAEVAMTAWVEQGKAVTR